MERRGRKELQKQENGNGKVRPAHEDTFFVSERVYDGTSPIQDPRNGSITVGRKAKRRRMVRSLGDR